MSENPNPGNEPNPNPAGDPPDPNQGDKKQKIKFDAAQTEFVNQLFETAFSKGASKAELEWQTKLNAQKAEFEAKLAEVQSKLPNPDDKGNPPPPNPPAPEIESFKAQLSEMKTVLDGIKTERDQLRQRVETADEERRRSRKKDEFLRAMKDANVQFFDPLEAYELAEKEGYEWDPQQDRPIVRNRQTGVERLNENGEPMTPVDFLKEFATRKKYLVKSATQDGGTGSGENRKVEEPPTKTKDWKSMSRDEFEAEREKIMRKVYNR